MSGNTDSNSGGGGGGGGGGDTPIVPSESAADLTNRIRIDTSKIKEEEPSPSSTSGGEGAGNDAGGGQPGMMQDSLSLMQLKRLVVEAPRLKVCLIDLSFLLYAPQESLWESINWTVTIQIGWLDFLQAPGKEYPNIRVPVCCRRSDAQRISHIFFLIPVF